MDMNRNILCIDLKSFFASCECVERNLDPFTTPLVVCNPERNGSITLAVTPYLKAKGIPSRGRAYNLPKDMNIIKVPPRMKLYQKKSKEVINIYLKYVSIEDLYIYSIDECFLDVTSYLKLYKLTDYELAKVIIKDIYDETGLTVTAGIGPNMLLAKVAMDIEAKHVKDNISKWTYDDVKTKLWKIKPLSKMWSIGSGLEKKLNALGLYTIEDVAKYDKNKLIKKFGVIGSDLWNHCNGIDTSIVSELNKIDTKEKSYSRSQILYKDYYGYNIPIILYETLNILCKELRKNRNLTSVISLGIKYSLSIGGSFHHSMKIDNPTDDINKLFDYIMYIFDRYYHDNLPIRQISIALSGFIDNSRIQLNLFEEYNDIENKKNMNNIIDEMKEKYGLNIILPASSLLNDSTIKERNTKIGGHNA